MDDGGEHIDEPGWYQTIHPQSYNTAHLHHSFVVFALPRIWFAKSSAALLKTN